MRAESDESGETRAVEEWFVSRGHRLEFELTAGENRWAAVVLAGPESMGGRPLLAALGPTKLEAARGAQSAFLQSPSPAT